MLNAAQTAVEDVRSHHVNREPLLPFMMHIIKCAADWYDLGIKAALFIFSEQTQQAVLDTNNRCILLCKWQTQTQLKLWWNEWHRGMFHLVCGIGTGLSRAQVQYVSILNTSWVFFFPALYQWAPGDGGGGDFWQCKEWWQGHGMAGWMPFFPFQLFPCTFISDWVHWLQPVVVGPIREMILDKWTFWINISRVAAPHLQPIIQ